MVFQFLTTTWKHWVKSPAITVIQLAGLVIGLTVFMLIFLWINNQLGYDRLGQNSDRVYRLEIYGEKMDGWMEMVPAAGPDLARNVAGIEAFNRFGSGWSITSLLVYEKPGGSRIETPAGSFYYADSAFFRLFPFPFLAGDPLKALTRPNSVVLTESLARRLFGKENPLGKVLDMRLPNSEKLIRQNYTVTGVIRDVNNFHYRFDFVGSIDYTKNNYESDNYTWDAWQSLGMLPTYFLLNEHADPQSVAREMTRYFTERVARREGYECRLRPLKSIYLHGRTQREMNIPPISHGDVRLIAGLSVIGVLILLMAIFNFINLNATRTLLRSKEIGIRKVQGAGRGNIFLQFTGEVVLLCLIAYGLSVYIIRMVLPYFNQLIGTNLAFGDLFSAGNVLTTVASLVLIAVLSGVIPSLSLASSNPVDTMKSGFLRRRRKGFSTNQVILAVQYVITMIVVAAALLVQKQVNFMRGSDPGIDLSDVYVGFSGIRDTSVDSKMDLFRNRMLQNPNISKMAFTHTVPPRIEPSYGFIEFGGKTIETHDAYVHPGFFDLLGVPIVDGRDFSYAMKDPESSDPGPNLLVKVILNEQAVREFELKDPVGSRGTYRRIPAEVVGVVRDFHFEGFKSSIPPIAFTCDGNSSYLVRIRPGSEGSALPFIRTLREELFDDDLLPESLAEQYDSQYRGEEQLSRLFGWFSLLAVLIAAIGIYGVSGNAIEQRIKEIGIRKANGATSWSILLMLQRQFARIILIAGVVAIPASFYLISRWLVGYPYKTRLSWWIFLASLALALLITLATISWRAWRAASSNPVNSLRYE